MSARESGVPHRWDDYILERDDEFVEFWQSHLGEASRDLLYVVGRGFDPRMLQALEAIADSMTSGTLDVLALNLDEGPESPSMEHLNLASQNFERLSELVRGKGGLESHDVRVWSPDGRRISSISAMQVFTSPNRLETYSDVVVDISAMPRAVYFPLIARLLALCEDISPGDGRPINLHIVVAESPDIDQRITMEGVDDEAHYVFPITGLEREANSGLPKVWIPFLGEGEHTQLERVYLLDPAPDEVCPLLPSPSRNPRRGDNLIIEYREFLFDQLRVEAGNFIYASEWNPFEVYRQVRTVVQHYRDSLSPLGGCRALLSTHGSKLMSMGALLAAYELTRLNMPVAIGQVESQGYMMNADALEQNPQGSTRLYEMWLSGECHV